MENAANYTKRLLRQGARARKSLGQNFLIDDNVIDEIIFASGLSADTNLVEIGPGLGVLTRKLVHQVEQMWAIELDEDKVGLLKEELKNSPVQIIHQDALKLRLSSLWGEEKKGYLIGNLPYYITSPLIMHFLDQAENLSGMTVMVQKEVADRLAADPGSKNYGILSIAVQAAAEVKTVLQVPPSAFNPAPKVHSAVVKFNLRPYPGLSVNQGAFMSVVKAAFSQRRKTLANSLSAGLGMDKGELTERLNKAGIDGQRRAETIDILEYQAITKEIKG